MPYNQASNFALFIVSNDKCREILIDYAKYFKQQNANDEHVPVVRNFIP